MPFVLCPWPKKVSFKSGYYVLAQDKTIVCENVSSAEALKLTRPLVEIQEKFFHFHWPVQCAEILPENTAVLIRIKKNKKIPTQGYLLRITAQKIYLTGQDGAGLFYGLLTLGQILQQFRFRIPCLDIEDAPDFSARGVMLDISRSKVPQMKTLFQIIDMLASFKINQLQLYTEHTFAYQKHKTVWQDASPLTAEEILTLDRYCRERFIDLVPNQNSFGHLEMWFKHKHYLPLAEVEKGYDAPWGYTPHPASLCPTDPESIKFVQELFAELLPNFSSSLFNVGCDETFDVGQGRSKQEVDRKGRERIWLDFFLKLYQAAKEHQKRVQFWADIILHNPKLIPQLPKDVIALIWGYAADHPFDQQCLFFKKARIPFYVCPGTSVWNTFVGNIDNSFQNLNNAAQFGIKHGAVGFLNTDWGDCGHWQYLPFTYLPLAYGAAVAWAYRQNQNRDIVSALNQFVLREKSGQLARTLFDLGQYRSGLKIPDPAWIFKYNFEFSKKPLAGLSPNDFKISNQRLERALTRLRRIDSTDPEIRLILREIRNGVAMIRLAYARAEILLKFIKNNKIPREKDLAVLKPRFIKNSAEHRNLWFARNRAGGLKRSIHELESYATLKHPMFT